mmetsp:Transcript_15209/g.35832  ORF Transcript_15209/g.35832 Transcript_15209/m.35832 type:complete len:294 (-) Transcript_15209:674-1555(-)
MDDDVLRRSERYRSAKPLRTPTSQQQVILQQQVHQQRARVGAAEHQLSSDWKPPPTNEPEELEVFHHNLEGMMQQELSLPQGVTLHQSAQQQHPTQTLEQGRQASASPPPLRQRVHQQQQRSVLGVQPQHTEEAAALGQVAALSASPAYRMHAAPQPSAGPILSMDAVMAAAAATTTHQRSQNVSASPAPLFAGRDDSHSASPKSDFQTLKTDGSAFGSTRQLPTMPQPTMPPPAMPPTAMQLPANTQAPWWETKHHQVDGQRLSVSVGPSSHVSRSPPTIPLAPSDKLVFES